MNQAVEGEGAAHAGVAPRGLGGRLRLMAAATALALLGACGGGFPGGEAAAPAGSKADEGTKRALAVDPPGNAGADARTRGVWGPLYKWPLIPIHAVLMPDSRVLTYGSRPDGSSTAFFSVDVWDNAGTPEQGHLTVANGTGIDLFCGTQLMLPPPAVGAPPQVLMAGGDAWTGVQSSFIGIRGSAVFNGASNTLAAGASMAQPRWYATAITLVNGETYVQGGLGGASVPEVRQTDGSFRQLSTADTSFLLWSYPRNYVMPDGRVFGYDFEGRMYFVDPSGTGRIAPRTILPLQYFGTGSSAMFRPGRILQVSGNTNAAAVIDVTSGEPVFTPTQSISSVRKLMTATLLADGQVLVTGGSPVWNEIEGANKSAELWNPTTGRWTLGAEGARPRLYHSTALLMPDGSVLVGGGGAPAPQGVDPRGEQNVQIYYPPYLFTAAGTPAPRPQITAVPEWLEIGKTFSVQTSSNNISRVTLVKTGTVTHGWNFEQRFLDLPFSLTPNGSGSTLTISGPGRAGEATPGYYMLFVFDSDGVPSVARILRMGVANGTNAATTPTLANPGAITQTLGTSRSIALSARDPNGDAITFRAAGLPPGVSLDARSGVISGTPTAAGSYDVVVSASDGTFNANASFVWTVQAESSLTLTLEPTPGASLVGSSAIFAAGASGQGVEYSWSFGDGTPDSGWSASGNVGHAYARPGMYSVTVRVRDASGALISRTFLQTVYLGHGTKAPGVSSNLLLEAPNYGRPRVWVANPDHGTITGFDANNFSRLGEVRVGNEPQAIARADNDRLWVTNKADATISIVDPATRVVLRTLTLPRASRPHGVAISSLAPQAFVVLEGTGELLRFDTNTYAQTGRLLLAPDIRHVSVDGRGQSVYVSRFITPPLPGESTAAVQTPAGQGGEVLEVSASAMTLTRKIVLAHSERPDAENQGRGIPNYLGAVAISPDGSQAYVPSKQDNIRRGLQRNGVALDFQSTVRAISSRIALTGAAAGTEDLARRIDHDNASVASAAVYDSRGVFLFVALETSREVAVIDAHSGGQLMRFDVGRAPQGLALSADGYLLYVHNFMDRTVSVHDLRPLLVNGLASVPQVASLSTVSTETLSPAVLLGKQLFYDARDPRLARDRYMSCASCHADGGHDGRTWDLTAMGEGLRNTISLKGRAGGQGRLHWSGNFDEVQDFETQIRNLAQGTGLLTSAQLATGTRADPLGDRKAGVSTELDALAAYVASLGSFDPSPNRAADGTLTAAALAGRTVFQAQCVACHGGADYTTSATGVLRNIGTLKATSGNRAGGPLTGIDPPTLRDAWATAPYLHDGSAATIEDAVRAHNSFSLGATDLANVSAFVRQIGREEPSVSDPTPPPPPPPPPPVTPTVRSSAIFGPSVGTAFTDAVANGQFVNGVSGRVGSRVFALQGLTPSGLLPLRGGSGGSAGAVSFGNETLVRIFGRTDALGVVQIGFMTSTGRVFGPYGQAGIVAGTQGFDFTVPSGSRVVGFTGRSSTSLNAVGVLYSP